MKKRMTVFFQIVILLVGIGALVFLIYEPQVEGVNAHATLFQIYFKDPFLAYVYAASSLFFLSLYKAFKVLGKVGENEGFSHENVKALRTIKHCALSMVGFVALGEVFIMASESDDRAGGIFMGLIFSLASIATAFAAAKFERILRNADADFLN